MTTATNGSSYFLAIWTGNWSSAFLYSLFFTYKFINNTTLHPDWWYCIVHTFHNAWMVLSTITDVRFPEKLKKNVFITQLPTAIFIFCRRQCLATTWSRKNPKPNRKIQVTAQFFIFLEYFSILLQLLGIRKQNRILLKYFLTKHNVKLSESLSTVENYNSLVYRSINYITPWT